MDWETLNNLISEFASKLGVALPAPAPKPKEASAPEVEEETPPAEPESPEPEAELPAEMESSEAEAEVTPPAEEPPAEAPAEPAEDTVSTETVEAPAEVPEPEKPVEEPQSETAIEEVASGEDDSAESTPEEETGEEHPDAEDHHPEDREYWKGVWELAAKIQEGFRTSHYPTKVDKDAAWDQFTQLRKIASRRQHRVLRKRSRSSRDWRGKILAKITEATPEGLDPAASSTPGKLRDMSNALREAGDMLTSAKEEMLSEQKLECFRGLRSARRAQEKVWAEIRKLRSKQREEFRTRMEANLEKNRERLKKSVAALEHQQKRRDELTQKIAEAWNTSWKEKAEGWLVEIDTQITDLEGVVERMKTWVKEDEDRLAR